MSDEIENIINRYKRRTNLSINKYSRINPEVQLRVSERFLALIKLLKKVNINDISNLKILEVGCGTGSNLLELLLLGAVSENLIGNDLLEDRLTIARRRLPKNTKLLLGDACCIDFPDNTFDIVYQSTVFSSILDDATQTKLAKKIWALASKGILWYDFIYNNPNNPDVRGVKVKSIRKLFPHGEIFVNKVTLAPPIARRIVPLHSSLYNLFNIFPFLRTHVLCFIKKS